MADPIVIDDERSALLFAEYRPTGDEEQQLTASSSSSVLSTTTKKRSERSLPVKALCGILFLACIQPLGFELIFPFINQMIVENGIVTDPERVGFYSGVIESVFAVMSFISIMPCTYMSDHFGRKPVILVGTMGLALSIGLFGVAKSYWFMIATRCIGGTLGGTWTAIKVMLAETVDKSHQGIAFSGFIIAYRMGQIIGQPMGGLLSHPEKNFSLFDTPFWHEYPFALPCFIASAFAVFAVIFAYFALEETLPARRTKKAASIYGTVTPSSELGEPVCAAALKRGRPSIRSVLTRQVVAAFLSSSLLALSSEAMFAVYSLFAFTPILSGGLGLNEAQIGTQLGFRSLNSVLVILTYPPIEHRLGTLRTYQLCTTFWPLAVMFFPLLNVLARHGWVGTWAFDAVVGMFFTMWSFGGHAFTGISIIINDSAPSAEALSLINGIAQMATTLSFALAPACTTSLFAFSIEHENILNGNLIWAVLLVIGLIATVQSLGLKEATHDWREDAKNREREEETSQAPVS